MRRRRRLCHRSRRRRLRAGPPEARHVANRTARGVLGHTDRLYRFVFVFVKLVVLVVVIAWSRLFGVLHERARTHLLVVCSHHHACVYQHYSCDGGFLRASCTRALLACLLVAWARFLGTVGEELQRSAETHEATRKSCLKCSRVRGERGWLRVLIDEVSLTDIGEIERSGAPVAHKTHMLLARLEALHSLQGAVRLGDWLGAWS